MGTDKKSALNTVTWAAVLKTHPQTPLWLKFGTSNLAVELSEIFLIVAPRFLFIRIPMPLLLGSGLKLITPTVLSSAAQEWKRS